LCITLAFLFSLALAGLSFADPVKKIEQQKMGNSENIAKEVQDKDTVMITNTALLPQSEELDTTRIDEEGTEDLIEETEGLAKQPQETAPDTAPTPEPTADMNDTPSEAKIHVKTDYTCYSQSDESVECVCETEDTCTALKQSNICQETSYWGMQDGFGGCTKIQVKADE
jgi:hypothetical protein